MSAAGRVFKFGKNIDTDSIFPGKYLVEFDPEKLAEHAMEGIDPSFHEKITRGDVIVAGPNFGCGSAREQAATTLKLAGVSAIVADSFARAFYRNAINNALPVIAIAGISNEVSEGDLMEVDIEHGIVSDITKKLTWKTKPAPRFVMEIINSGGAISYYREKIEARSESRIVETKE